MSVGIFAMAITIASRNGSNVNLISVSPSWPAENTKRVPAHPCGAISRGGIRATTRALNGEPRLSQRRMRRGRNYGLRVLEDRALAVIGDVLIHRLAEHV